MPALEPALSVVVLVAWGYDSVQANLALENGFSYARTFNFTVRESLTSHGTPMSAAPLVDVALRHFLRRDVTYGQAWWLVRRSAFSPRDWENLRAVAPGIPARSPFTR
ncbi:hypothetical protein [Yinghuangia sp. YIM S10712]|uniref:hypothetical protein n=1 Tax=Yinghuangia sp. YIM S10712 TaxID=3436930 RepID=UPI003F529B53